MSPIYQETRMNTVQKETPTSKIGIITRTTGRLRSPLSSWNPNGPGKAKNTLMLTRPSEKKRVLKRSHTAGDQPELLDPLNLNIRSLWKLMNQNPRPSRDQRAF